MRRPLSAFRRLSLRGVPSAVRILVKRFTSPTINLGLLDFKKKVGHLGLPLGTSYFANQALNLSLSSSPLSDQNSAFSKTAVLKLFGAVGICGIILIPAVA